MTTDEENLQRALERSRFEQSKRDSQRLDEAKQLSLLEVSGDAKISSEELKDALKHRFNIEMSEETTRGVIREFDVDGDGCARSQPRLAPLLSLRRNSVISCSLFPPQPVCSLTPEAMHPWQGDLVR